MTVALDARGTAVARPWIERAQARYPSLIDASHQLDRLGVVNVPTGIWIDEAGMIVRPPEPAHPRRPAYKDQIVPADASDKERLRIETVKALHVEIDRHAGRSRPRGVDDVTAGAHFALAGPEHSAIYGTTWLDEVKREGVQSYYPPLELQRRSKVRGGFR